MRNSPELQRAAVVHLRDLRRRLNSEPVGRASPTGGELAMEDAVVVLSEQPKVRLDSVGPPLCELGNSEGCVIFEALLKCCSNAIEEA